MTPIKRSLDSFAYGTVVHDIQKGGDEEGYGQFFEEGRA
jgi:hypothetical protein